MADKKEFKYEIGGRVFIQRPLVLGQLKQLIDHVMKDLIVPETDSLDPMMLLEILGDKLPLGLAIILTEEGKSPKDKNILQLGEDLYFEITAEQTMEVIADFFVCTPVTSLLSMFTEKMKDVQKSLTEAGLSKSA